MPAPDSRAIVKACDKLGTSFRVRLRMPDGSDLAVWRSRPLSPGSHVTVAPDQDGVWRVVGE